MPIAQLVERWIVVPDVESSNLFGHPMETLHSYVESLFLLLTKKQSGSAPIRDAATLLRTIAPYFLAESTLWMRSSMAALSCRSLSVRKLSLIHI